MNQPHPGRLVYRIYRRLTEEAHVVAESVRTTSLERREELFASRRRLDVHRTVQQAPMCKRALEIGSQMVSVDSVVGGNVPRDRVGLLRDEFECEQARTVRRRARAVLGAPEDVLDHFGGEIYEASHRIDEGGGKRRTRFVIKNG